MTKVTKEELIARLEALGAKDVTKQGRTTLIVASKKKEKT